VYYFVYSVEVRAERREYKEEVCVVTYCDKCHITRWLLSNLINLTLSIYLVRRSVSQLLGVDTSTTFVVSSYR